MTKNKFYVERDMGVGAYLIAKNFQYAGLQSIGGNVYAFKFLDPDNTGADAVQEYWNDGGAPAGKVIHALRTLKDELQKTKTSKRN